MKKKFLIFLSILILSSAICNVQAKTTINSELSNAIKLYKAGNYTECYDKLNLYIKKDTSNGLAYYYLAMTSAQIGKSDEAVENYSKAISLSSSQSNLHRFATKGKRCIEEPDKCQESLFESKFDEFVQQKRGAAVTDKVRGDYERLKIENMMREINRSDEIDPQRFRDYKDFSSYNMDSPSNDEIVAALRTLQQAGLTDFSYFNDRNQNQLMNMLGSSSVNPQILQSLLTNNMTLGF